jgi:hypothetical protein
MDYEEHLQLLRARYSGAEALRLDEEYTALRLARREH